MSVKFDYFTLILYAEMFITLYSMEIFVKAKIYP